MNIHLIIVFIVCIILSIISPYIVVKGFADDKAKTEYQSWYAEKMDVIDKEISREKAFVNLLYKVSSAKEVRNIIAGKIKIGDSIEKHRAFLSLAISITYNPYFNEFQFIYFQDGHLWSNNDDSYWKLVITVNDKLEIKDCRAISIKY